MDVGGLAVLVIGGYILIKYGPQIAQNLQQQQAAAAPPPAATGTSPPATTGPAAPAPASPPVNITFTNPSITPDTQVPGASFGVFPTAPSRFQGVNLAAPFTQNPSTATSPKAPDCATSAEDAACGFKGHPKCCAGNTLLGGIVQTAAGGPAKTPVSTRASKPAAPKRTRTLNPQCEGNPCGVTIPGKCLQASTGNEVACTQSSNLGTAYSYAGSYFTQVVNGKKRITIDPYFPAGFYNSQANYRSSLKEPALH